MTDKRKRDERVTRVRFAKNMGEVRMKPVFVPPPDSVPLYFTDDMLAMLGSVFTRAQHYLDEHVSDPEEVREQTLLLVDLEEQLEDQGIVDILR